MKFFLDENFPKAASKLLEQRGHQVIDIRGTENEGISDHEILEFSRKESAIFLTCDRDFFHTIHLTHKPHAGIIVITLRRPNAKSILEKLTWVVDNQSKFQFQNKCILLSDSKCSVYH
jgi:predicted nuclease of predicted toxin-antitoxin system